MEGWQSTPVVNIFKQCDVENKKNVELSGKVALRMDETIHKKVFKVAGSIPAVNFIKVPKDKVLGLTGRFLYLQVKFEPGAPLFSVHTELVTADSNTCRVSVGNIFKAENLKKKAGCVQLSLPDPPAGWVLLSLDLQAAVAAGGPGVSSFKAVKSIQLCATITVRGAFSSDVRFGPKTLPRDMVLSHALDAPTQVQIWSPCEPADVPEPTIIKRPILSKRTPARSKRQAAPAADEADIQASDQSPPVPAATKQHSSKPRETLSKQVSALTLSPELSAVSSSKSVQAARTADVAPQPLVPEPFMYLKNVNGFSGEFCRCVLYNAATDELVFPAGAIVIALAAGQKNCQSAEPAAAAPGAGSQQQLAQQRFFIGHSAFVSCLALGKHGRLLVTGQEGKQPQIRLWDCSKPQLQQEDHHQQQQAQAGCKCLAICCAHASNLTALDVTCDGRYLVACGADNLARQTLAVWDIYDVHNTRRVHLLVKAVTSHHICVLRFSPFEPDHFVSAGRDNIRVHRLKGGEIRSISIKMQVAAGATHTVTGGAAPSIIGGPKVFTDIAFEASKSGLQLPTQHMFVATAGGAVFQVDYARRALTAVYQLHAAAINSICIGDGLALTASDDTTVRLWPLNFSSFLLEAQHDTPVTSACLASPDGLLLVAGCEDGSLGQLDVVGRQHTSLLKSHRRSVDSLVAHPHRCEYMTTSIDGSIRIWDGTAHQQRSELGNTVQLSSERVSCHPTCAAYSAVGIHIAVGYKEGMVRLFDANSAELLQERQQHIGSVIQVLFTLDGSKLLSCGCDGRVIAYAVHHCLLPVKALTTPLPQVQASGPAGGNRLRSSSGNKPAGNSNSTVCAAVSSDGQWIAVGQPADMCSDDVADTAGGGGIGGGVAVVLYTAQLEPVLQISSAASSIARLVFAPDSSCVWAIVQTPAEADEGTLTARSGREMTAFPNTAQGTSVSTTCSLLCCSVADGAVLRAICEPHGAAAVNSICLDVTGSVLVTCGADHVVKLWNVAQPHNTTSHPAQQLVDCSSLPGCQRFTAHHGPVTGAAFLGGQLLTAGADGNICIWQLVSLDGAESRSRGEGSGSAPVRGHSTEQSPMQQYAPGGPQDRSPSHLQQLHLDAFKKSSLQHWLEPRRAAGAATGVCGGVAIMQQQPTLVDTGVVASPLFSAPAAGAGDTTYSSAGGQLSTCKDNSHISPAVHAVCCGSTDPLVSCSAVLGVSGSRCGVLWLKQTGQLAYTAANTLVLLDLATRHQSLMCHHWQNVSALAASADGQLLATGSAAAEPAGGYADVAVWDVRKCCLLMLLQQHPVSVEVLCFSPDGAWLLSVGSGRVVVWDLAASRAAAVGTVKLEVRGAAWLPHCPQPTFVTCGGDGLLVWTLTATLLQQWQLDIPDIALPVQAAADTAVATGAGLSAGSGPAGAGHVTHPAGCVLTAICTAASSGSWAFDSLSGASGPLGSAVAGDAPADDPVAFKQQRQEAASTVFAADSGGGVWQLTIGAGRLCGCVKVTTLRSDDFCTALQWSQAAAALAVGTSRGRLLRFEAPGGTPAAVTYTGDGHHGHTHTPTAAATAALQWWTAVGAGAARRINTTPAISSVPSWTPCQQPHHEPRGPSSAHQEEPPHLITLSGPVTRVCLDPAALQEGVVSASSASAWYVDLKAQQTAPLLAGHAAPVCALLPGPGGAASTLVASLGRDGCLAVWDTSTAADAAAGSSSKGDSSRGMLQVPHAEWRSHAPALTAAAFVPEASLCVLGHADGSIALLQTHGTDSCTPADQGHTAVNTAMADGEASGGVLRWRVVRHPSPVVACVVHPDKPLVLAVSSDGLITTTYIESGALLASCSSITGQLTPLHDFAAAEPQAAPLAAQGEMCVAGGNRCTLAAAAWLDQLLVFEAPWGADAAQVVSRYQCPEVPSNIPAAMRACVSFIPGSTSLLLFISPCLGPCALLYDFHMSCPLRHLALTSHPTSLAVAPAGQLFAFGMSDGRIVLTDAAAEGSLELRVCGGSGADEAAVKAVTFAAGGSKLLCAVGTVITVWDA